MKYSDLVAFSTAGSVPTANVYAFRINSLYDPDFTSTGHQPYQFDQLSAVYNNFLVSKVDVAVRFRNPDLNTHLWAGVQFVTDTDVGAAGSAAGKTVPNIREIGNSYMRPLGINDNRTSMFSYEATVDIAKQFGLNYTEYHGDLTSFSGIATSNPARQCFMQLIVADPSSGASKGIEVDVDIVYHALLYGYKSPAQS
jgi:predicted porin